MLEILASEIPSLDLPPVEASSSSISRQILPMVLSSLFKAPNRAARVNQNVRTTNAQRTPKTNQPPPANNTNTSINLQSVPAAAYVSAVSIIIIIIDGVCYFRSKTVSSKPMSLGMKILIASVIGVAAVGAIAGPATYFALAGKKRFC